MNRRDIYYWKCDRPAAFHGTDNRIADSDALTPSLYDELSRHFSTTHVLLRRGSGQGNHLTWLAEVDGTAMFIRVENGPERDSHLLVESALLDRVRTIGVSTPQVFGCDVSRNRVPFAWQALERIAVPDLNQWFKQGTLNIPFIAFEIGVAVAKWQSLIFAGFGVLDENLCGYHTRYSDYFDLRLEQHIHFLTKRGFLTHGAEVLAVIDRHRDLLELKVGCLVHKDLALWNILGSETSIAAFIDFDDTISGDPMDDLSLLACFHDAAFLQQAFAGYTSIRALPDQYLRRFWLHLLRNMIVKAVIRVGAGYFDRDDGFFLIGSGMSGANLRDLTSSRIELALNGLRHDWGLEKL